MIVKKSMVTIMVILSCFSVPASLFAEVVVLEQYDLSFNLPPGVRQLSPEEIQKEKLRPFAIKNVEPFIFADDARQIIIRLDIHTLDDDSPMRQKSLKDIQEELLTKFRGLPPEDPQEEKLVTERIMTIASGDWAYSRRKHPKYFWGKSDLLQFTDQLVSVSGDYAFFFYFSFLETDEKKFNGHSSQLEDSWKTIRIGG